MKQSSTNLWKTAVDSARSEILATRRQEAAALLEINQRVRVSAVRTLLASVLVAAGAGIAAIDSHNRSVLVPLPSIVLLLSSLAFQQFAEVSVLGAARSQLESAVNDELEAAGLVYESHVSGIRQRPPLVKSVRILQCVWAAGILILLVAATIAAYDQHAVWVPALYTAFTLATALSCAASYRDMLRSGPTAASALDRAKAL
jgi:hypothetical protein